MSIEAMKQALEALEAYQHNGSVQLFDEAITSLRQAIAEAEKQEPVAWVVYSSSENDIVWADKGKRLKQNTPLYTHPQPKREPLTDEQPMRWAVFCGICRKEWSVPYHHPGKSVCDDCVAAHGIKEKNT